MNLEALEALLQIRDAIGASLSSEQQLFVSEHYPKIANYMRTAQGRSAIQAFVCNWQSAMTPAVPPPQPAAALAPAEPPPQAVPVIDATPAHPTVIYPGLIQPVSPLPAIYR